MDVDEKPETSDDAMIVEDDAPDAAPALDDIVAPMQQDGEATETKQETEQSTDALPDDMSQAPTETRPPEPISLHYQGSETPNYKTKYILAGHTRSLAAIKFSPDGTMLASCGEYQLIQRYIAHSCDNLKESCG